jgi:colicin import membrane protein
MLGQHHCFRCGLISVNIQLMKTRSNAYPMPLALALFLHMLIIIGLSFHFAAKSYRPPGPVRPHAHQIVEATAITEHQLNHQMKQLRQHKMKIMRAKAQKIERRQAAALAKKEQLIQQRLRLQAQKIKQTKLKQLMKQQQQLEQKQAQQQRQQEHQQLQQISAAYTKGVVDRYKGLIVQKLRGYWQVPADIDHNLHCLYRVELAPNGVVLSATLMKSSGNPALDRLAKATIMKASPLPVPKNTAVFDTMRELQLIMTPGSKNFEWLG